MQKPNPSVSTQMEMLLVALTIVLNAPALWEGFSNGPRYHICFQSMFNQCYSQCASKSETDNWSAAANLGQCKV